MLLIYATNNQNYLAGTNVFLMIRFLFLCFLCIMIFAPGKSQYYYYNDKYLDNNFVFELGGSFGTMNAITDLGGQPWMSKKKYINEINWQAVNKNGGVYLGAWYKQLIGARLELTYGSVCGSDSFLVKGTPRFERNLSFRSDIREIAFLAEFHPIYLGYFEDGPPRFSPYLVGGGGWFNFDPQASINGKWIDLQPLNLEGQGFREYPDRKPYKLAQPNLAFGVGVKYELTDIFNVRVEWLHRYLFTDYLDDVSLSYVDPKLFNKYYSPAKAAMAQSLYLRGQRNNKNRGMEEHTDSYFTINMKLGVTFGRSRR